MILRRFVVVGVIAAALVVAAGCGGDDGDPASGGTVSADGSSTVGPFTQRAATEFLRGRRDLEIDVDISRTSRGFERDGAAERIGSGPSRGEEGGTRRT